MKWARFTFKMSYVSFEGTYVQKRSHLLLPLPLLVLHSQHPCGLQWVHHDCPLLPPPPPPPPPLLHVFASLPLLASAVPLPPVAVSPPPPPAAVAPPPPAEASLLLPSSWLPLFIKTIVLSSG